MDQPDDHGPGNSNLSPRVVSYDESDNPDARSAERWSQIPEPLRKSIEEHVEPRLTAEILEKLDELHARGLPIFDDEAFFYFGGGLAVRNICREKFSDEELAQEIGATECFLTVGTRFNRNACRNSNEAPVSNGNATKRIAATRGGH